MGNNGIRDTALPVKIKRDAKIKTVTGVGWSGLWKGGRVHPKLGWMITRFISPNVYGGIDEEQEKVLLNSEETSGLPSTDFVRVKITIEPIYNRRGELVIRRCEDNK